MSEALATPVALRCGRWERALPRTSDLPSFFGWGGGILTVRRRSTGEAHSYATGVGSAWFGALLMDMARGRFAPRGRLPAHA